MSYEKCIELSLIRQADCYFIPDSNESYCIDVTNGVVLTRLWQVRAYQPWVNGAIEDFHPLIPGTSANGYYLQVTLRIRGESKGKEIHRLVCEAVHGPCPYGMQACHNNGNSFDNRPDNLRWDTPPNNSLDRRLHGTANSGERNGGAFLDWAAVHQLRADRKVCKLTYAQLAAKYLVSIATVGEIIRNESWIDV